MCNAPKRCVRRRANSNQTKSGSFDTSTNVELSGADAISTPAPREFFEVSPKEWLAGWRLPEIYERIFGRKSFAALVKGEPYPTTRQRWGAPMSDAPRFARELVSASAIR